MAGRQGRHHAVAGAWAAAQFGLSGLPDPSGDLGVKPAGDSGVYDVQKIFCAAAKTALKQGVTPAS
ncbi:hypothetical protein [Pseudooceanicola sp.]|uniref:hypothetical protein n=1 Tax=Pseudooceanicola sp. TaxID=1914328 RepID=UPI003516B6FF